MSQPKTPQRRARLRRHNRPMPRRRLDINVDAVHYRNPELLQKFVSDSGKILPRRTTGVTARIHRLVTNAIKQARHALLMK